ncbi:MAG: hypothetical protein ACI9C2_002306 [Gammaproteobacteria bacterium]|jgi:hypothetical protein
MSIPTSSIDNRKQIGWSPTSLLLIVVSVTMLGTLGVVAGPVMGYRSALAREAAMEQAEGALTRIRGQSKELKRAVDHRQMTELSELLHSYIPSHPDPIALYGQVRSAADLSGVSLETLTATDEEEALGPGGQGKWVYLTKLDLAGQAHPAAIERLLELLRLAGQPTLVTNFRIQRSRFEQPEFQFRLQLGFPYYDTPPLAPESNLGMQTASQP